MTRYTPPTPAPSPDWPSHNPKDDIIAALRAENARLTATTRAQALRLYTTSQREHHLLPTLLATSQGATRSLADTVDALSAKLRAADETNAALTAEAQRVKCGWERAEAKLESEKALRDLQGENFEKWVRVWNEVAEEREREIEGLKGSVERLRGKLEGERWERMRELVVGAEREMARR